MMLADAPLALADGFGTIVTIAILWAVLSLFGKAQQAARRQQEAQRRRGQGSPPAPPRRLEAGRPEARSALEELLRALEGKVEGAERGPMGRQGSSLPSAEEVEEDESLEVEEQVVSLESEPDWNTERPVVSQDAGAEALVELRLQAAAARNRALTAADHRAFDERIRQEAADHTAAVRRPGASLRDAVVWREILGPPVGLRPDGL